MSVPSYQSYQNPGFPPQASSFLMNTQAAAQDKINRELFVGNTPPGTSEVLLLHFFNAAMRRVGLCQPYETPVLNSRVNSKFAFIELISADMANRALNMTGVPFLGGVLLKVSRPSKYTGTVVKGTKTWQQLTGQSLPADAMVDPEQEKIRRELFIGNTTPEMSEIMLKEFLGNAMEQVGLTTAPGNPITACRVSGKFAFVELRSAHEAANALNLNNIPYMATSLRVGRPSKYTGPPEQHGNWEDILAKYMSGELQLPNQQQEQQQQQQQQLPPTRVVQLKHMLNPQDLENADEYNDILEDTRDECSQYGQLVSVVIPKANEVGATEIFLEYASCEEAAKAIQGLQGRTFDGKQVEARFFDEAKFAAKNYAGN
jgi:splicing factor U2AF subunit